MTTEEREALLKLWADVPGTKPGNLFWVTDYHGSQWQDNELIGGCGPQGESAICDAHAAAIARDAMAGWLLKQRPFLCLSAGGPDGSHERGVHCQATLVALVDACRRVAGVGA